MQRTPTLEPSVSEALAIQRADRVRIEKEDVPIASAEDLVLHKLFAGRPRDIEDARGVVRRRGWGLDWSYMEKWAREFSEIPGREELPGVLAGLRELAEDSRREDGR